VRGAYPDPSPSPLLPASPRSHGAKNWKVISALFPLRTDVQCLHRWQKVLKPGLVKGPWTLDEDDQVRSLVAQHGTKKWSLIAQNLEGRLGKQCRERWYNHLDPAIKRTPWCVGWRPRGAHPPPPPL